MEDIFSNYGYHHIAQRIWKNLDYESISMLRQTNTSIRGKCDTYLVQKIQNNKKLDFGMLYCQDCHKPFMQQYADFANLVEENQIHHEFYFRSPCLKNGDQKMEKILEEFVKKLFDITPYYLFRRRFNLLVNRCRCFGNDRIFHCVIPKIESIMPKLVNFIPAKCPENSRPYLMKMLRYAVGKCDLQMAKSLLSPLKEYDTCLRTILSALDLNLDYGDKNVEIIKQIVFECKNPNVPDENGNTAMHLAVKLGCVKVVRILMELSASILDRNKRGQTPLDFLEENFDFRLVHLLLSDSKYKKEIDAAIKNESRPLLKRYYFCISSYFL